MTDLKSILQSSEGGYAPVDVDAVIERGDRLRRRRVIASAGLGAAAVMVLIAGGLGLLQRTSNTDNNPVALLAGAGDAARDAGSARMRIVMEATTGTETSRTDIEGVVDFTDNRGRLEVTTGEEQVTILGDGAIVYVSVPDAHRGATQGKPWLSYPAPDVSDGIINLADPTRLLDELRETSDVRVIGEETVNGYAAIHYSAAASGSGNSATTAAKVDVWMTDDGLPTKIIVESAFGPLRFHITVDLLDFGIELDTITPPSSADVFAGDERLATQWLQLQIDPASTGSIGEAASCSILPFLAEAFDQQADAISEEQLAELEAAIAQVDSQASAIDDSTPEGAQQKEGILAAASVLRALVTAAKTGQPADIEALWPTVDDLAQNCGSTL